MNNRKLTWRHLKSLNELYVTGNAASTILDNHYIRSVLFDQLKLVKYKAANLKRLVPSEKYHGFYEPNFKQEFDLYEKFLNTYRVAADGKRQYSEEDIRTLMFIAEHRQELVTNLTTLRTFSSQIFKGMGSKYLEQKKSLLKAVCQILEISEFPDKDPKSMQWRFVVDVPTPKYVVLCENLAYLKAPWKSRERNIELWYVGGNNTGIVDFISEEKLHLPLYYSCDWDLHGLAIYSRLKQKFDKKNVVLQLLIPTSIDAALSTSSPHHNSRWDFSKTLSGLSVTDFNEDAKSLIEELIMTDKWLEEESLNLLDQIPHQVT